jgi:hypothetical protein
MDPTPTPAPVGFNQRYIDPTTGRKAGTIEWDRSWSTVKVHLRKTELPPVHEMRLFEGPGLRAPTEEGEVVVRIDRSSFTPRFVLTINGTDMVPVLDESIETAQPTLTPWNPSGAALRPYVPLQQFPQPVFPHPAFQQPAFQQPAFPQPQFPQPSFPQPSFGTMPPPSTGTSSTPPIPPTPPAPPVATEPARRKKAMLPAIGAIVFGVLVVAGGVFGLQRWGDANKQIIAAPTTPPVPTYAVTIPATFASVYEHLVQQANFYGAPDPQAAATCMQTEYPAITDSDVDFSTATYRSAQYRCMPDQMTLRWTVTATGIQEADKPCANAGTTAGMAKLSLEDMERTVPFNNTADYPPDIQDQLIATVQATCPGLPPDIAERVIKE